MLTRITLTAAGSCMPYMSDGIARRFPSIESVACEVAAVEGRAIQ